MSGPSTRLVVISVGVLVLLIAAVGVYVRYRLAGPLVLNAPPPSVVADTLDTEPEATASSIDVLVTYNLGTAVDSLEAAVPRTYGDIEHKLPIANTRRANFAYAVRRSPFRVRVSGQTLSISADVEYQGKVWYRPPIGPELSAGCGTGDEPRPRVHATLACTAQLTPHWQLRTDTRVLRLEPFSDDDRDRCRLTVLRIDVTDRVIEETQRMLEQNLQKFDTAVTHWPVRARFVGAWAQLQRPIWLANGVYLEINPYAAELGSVGAEGDTVMARLRMLASPRVVDSAPADRDRPLPPLQTARNIGSGAHVAVEASFTYPVATTLLRRALVGRSLEQDGHRIQIRDVRLAGIGGGRVALSVTLAGRAQGRLYFTGTPSLDPVHHEISVPDLEFDVGTAQMLVRGYAWLKGVDIRDFLRARARLPESQAVGKLRGLAESAINRTLAPGVTLSGRIHDARATSVRTTSREIRLRAAADAEFKLAIDRAPALPRLAKAGGR
jgi:hypothetical protein